MTQLHLTPEHKTQYTEHYKVSLRRSVLPNASFKFIGNRDTITRAVVFAAMLTNRHRKDTKVEIIYTSPKGEESKPKILARLSYKAGLNVVTQCNCSECMYHLEQWGYKLHPAMTQSLTIAYNADNEMQYRKRRDRMQEEYKEQFRVNVPDGPHNIFAKKPGS